jgi:hypothetical protein
MIMSNRNGEQGFPPPRGERYQFKEGYWYYCTREGVDIGPFLSQPSAEQGAREFIAFIQDSEPKLSATSR